MLSFHSHYSTRLTIKIGSIVVFLLFSIGVMLTSFYNLALVPNVINIIGIFLVALGIIGIYGLLALDLHRLWFSTPAPIQPTPPSPFSTNETIRPLSLFHYIAPSSLYLYLMCLSLTIRLLSFSASPGDSDKKSAHIQPYLMMMDTVTVIFLSVLYSTELKLNFVLANHRLAMKRNFVRYISQ
jgi:hypothetical protein